MSFVLPFTDRFALIIAGLCQALAARGGRDRAFAPTGLLLWKRLHRMLHRFRSLVARGGRPSRPSVPRPGRARSNREGSPRWPRGFASLVRQVPEAAAYGSQLQALLSEPDMAALVAHSPQAGRLLRPLCQMLGVRSDSLLPPPAPRPAAEPAASRQTTADPPMPPKRPPAWPAEACAAEACAAEAWPPPFPILQ